MCPCISRPRGAWAEDNGPAGICPLRSKPMMWDVGGALAPAPGGVNGARQAPQPSPNTNSNSSGRPSRTTRDARPQCSPTRRVVRARCVHRTPSRHAVCSLGGVSMRPMRCTCGLPFEPVVSSCGALIVHEQHRPGEEATMPAPAIKAPPASELTHPRRRQQELRRSLGGPS